MRLPDSLFHLSNPFNVMNFPFVCREIRAAAVFFAILATPVAFAASAAWNVNNAGNWATAGSWNPAAAPGATSGTSSTDIATFGLAITGDRIVTVDTNRNIGGITFSNTSNFKYTLSGGSLLLSDTGVIQTASGNGAHIDTISTPITIQGDGTSATFSAKATSASSVMNIGAVSGGSPAFSVTTLNLEGTNTGANTISGIISDGAPGAALAIVKSQAGTWTLSGANTHSGGTTIYDGMLIPTVAGALGTGFVMVDGSNTAILSLGTANVTAGAVYLTSGKIDSTTGTLTGSSFTVQNGTITAKLAGASADLTKSNLGTVILTGANTYAGNTNVDDGILQVKTPGSLPGQTISGKIRIATGATLALNVGGAGEFTATDVANVLTNTFFSSGGFLGLDTTTTPSTFTYSTTIAGTDKAIAKLGTGTLTLDGAASNTHSGGTKVLAGTLTAGKTNALGTGPFTVDGNAAILNLGTFNQAVGTVSLGSNGGTINGTGILTGSSFYLENGTISAKLAGSGGLSKILTGMVTLSGANTYTGGNLVSGGTLKPLLFLLFPAMTRPM